jgi:hypothetical protein
MKLERIDYKSLNSRQREAFNYQKLSAVLADFGFNTIRLSDDWRGADFIAQHCQTGEFLPVQLKARFGCWKKYQGKNVWVAFPHGDDWYLYDHDAVLHALEALESPRFQTRSWKKENGNYHSPSISKQIRKLLEPYRLTTNP